jgi:hypothetical protein
MFMDCDWQAWEVNTLTASLLFVLASTPLDFCAMAHNRRRAKKASPRPHARRSTRLQDKEREEREKSAEIEAVADPAESEREGSPPWVDIDFSADNVSNDSDCSRSSSPESQGGNDQHGSDPTPAPLDDEQPHARPSQAKNARSPHWQSWQDRYLALAVDETCPFLLPPSEREAGWNRTADVLYRNSCAAGPRSTIERSGSACKNRFMKLMKEHKVCRIAFPFNFGLHLLERRN